MAHLFKTLFQFLYLSLSLVTFILFLFASLSISFFFSLLTSQNLSLFLSSFCSISLLFYSLFTFFPFLFVSLSLSFSLSFFALCSISIFSSSCSSALLSSSLFSLLTYFYFIFVSLSLLSFSLSLFLSLSLSLSFFLSLSLSLSFFPLLMAKMGKDCAFGWQLLSIIAFPLMSFSRSFVRSIDGKSGSYSTSSKFRKKLKSIRAVVVAQLVELLLPITQVRGSNPVIGK